MTDQTRSLTIPDFAAVPRAKDRANGWKPEVQRAFIEALAETGSVRSACARVARADHGAYLLRRHPEAAGFRAAWDVALDIGMRRIEDVAMDRALHGVETPVYSYGKIVGTRTVYNDRLLMFMLRNRAPDRFTGGKAQALSAVDKAELARLKKQWAKDYERTRAIEENARAREHENWLAERLETMHRRWFTGFGPQTRAAYRAFRESEIAEAEADYQRRYAGTDAQIARGVEDLGECQEHLENAPDPDAADDAREALTEAEAILAAQAADERAAEADYAEWFAPERRAKVWWAIDVVFGAASAPDGDAPENEQKEQAT